jgi:uncharacterized membrane protein
MAYCTKCGAAVAENAAFCAACGAPQSSVPNAGQGAAPAATPTPTQPQMAENIAGLLCYALGWLTGLIFYFIDKRPYVRFHAAQSIVVFGGLHILLFAFGMFFGISLLAGGWTGFSLGYAIHSLVGLATFVLWILLMIKAYQGERFRVPVAADFAGKIFGKT